MSKERAWEEYYMQYIDGNFETGPVTVEEQNQIWIEMRENANNQENLDWMQAFVGDIPKPPVMSVEALNEIYVAMYIGTGNAEIKDFPIYRTLPAA